MDILFPHNDRELQDFKESALKMGFEEITVECTANLSMLQPHDRLSVLIMGWRRIGDYLTKNQYVTIVGNVVNWIGRHTLELWFGRDWISCPADSKTTLIEFMMKVYPTAYISMCPYSWPYMFSIYRDPWMVDYLNANFQHMNDPDLSDRLEAKDSDFIQQEGLFLIFLRIVNMFDFNMMKLVKHMCRRLLLAWHDTSSTAHRPLRATVNAAQSIEYVRHMYLMTVNEIDGLQPLHYVLECVQRNMHCNSIECANLDKAAQIITLGLLECKKTLVEFLIAFVSKSHERQFSNTFGNVVDKYKSFLVEYLIRKIHTRRAINNVSLLSPDGVYENLVKMFIRKRESSEDLMRTTATISERLFARVHDLKALKFSYDQIKRLTRVEWYTTKVTLLLGIISEELNTLEDYKYTEGQIADELIQKEQDLAIYYRDLSNLLGRTPALEQEAWLTTFSLHPCKEYLEAVTKCGSRNLRVIKKQAIRLKVLQESKQPKVTETASEHKESLSCQSVMEDQTLAAEKGKLSSTNIIPSVASCSIKDDTQTNKAIAGISKRLPSKKTSSKTESIYHNSTERVTTPVSKNSPNYDDRQKNTAEVMFAASSGAGESVLMQTEQTIKYPDFALINSVTDTEDVIKYTNYDSDVLAQYRELTRILSNIRLQHSDYDDLLALLIAPRYKRLTWATCWKNLRKRCRFLLTKENKKKQLVEQYLADANERLTHLQIDYEKFKNKPQIDYGSIEDGYECFDTESGDDSALKTVVVGLKGALKVNRRNNKKYHFQEGGPFDQDSNKNQVGSESVQLQTANPQLTTPKIGVLLDLHPSTASSNESSKVVAQPAYIVDPRKPNISAQPNKGNQNSPCSQVNSNILATPLSTSTSQVNVRCQYPVGPMVLATPNVSLVSKFNVSASHNIQPANSDHTPLNTKIQPLQIKTQAHAHSVTVKTECAQMAPKVQTSLRVQTSSNALSVQADSTSSSGAHGLSKSREPQINQNVILLVSSKTQGSSNIQSASATQIQSKQSNIPANCPPQIPLTTHSNLIKQSTSCNKELHGSQERPSSQAMQSAQVVQSRQIRPDASALPSFQILQNTQAPQSAQAIQSVQPRSSAPAQHILQALQSRQTLEHVQTVQSNQARRCAQALQSGENPQALENPHIPLNTHVVKKTQVNLPVQTQLNQVQLRSTLEIEKVPSETFVARLPLKTYSRYRSTHTEKEVQYEAKSIMKEKCEIEVIPIKPKIEQAKQPADELKISTSVAKSSCGDGSEADSSNTAIAQEERTSGSLTPKYNININKNTPISKEASQCDGNSYRGVTINHIAEDNLSQQPGQNQHMFSDYQSSRDRFGSTHSVRQVPPSYITITPLPLSNHQAQQSNSSNDNTKRSVLTKPNSKLINNPNDSMRSSCNLSHNIKAIDICASRELKSGKQMPSASVRPHPYKNQSPIHSYIQKLPTLGIEPTRDKEDSVGSIGITPCSIQQEHQEIQCSRLHKSISNLSKDTNPLSNDLDTQPDSSGSSGIIILSNSSKKDSSNHYTTPSNCNRSPHFSDRSHVIAPIDVITPTSNDFTARSELQTECLLLPEEDPVLSGKISKQIPFLDLRANTRFPQDSNQNNQSTSCAPQSYMFTYCAPELNTVQIVKPSGTTRINKMRVEIGQGIRRKIPKERCDLLRLTSTNKFPNPRWRPIYNSIFKRKLIFVPTEAELKMILSEYKGQRQNGRIPTYLNIRGLTEDHPDEDILDESVIINLTNPKYTSMEERPSDVETDEILTCRTNNINQSKPEVDGQEAGVKYKFHTRPPVHFFIGIPTPAYHLSLFCPSSREFQNACADKTWNILTIEPNMVYKMFLFLKDDDFAWERFSLIRFHPPQKDEEDEEEEEDEENKADGTETNKNAALSERNVTPIPSKSNGPEKKIVQNEIPNESDEPTDPKDVSRSADIHPRNETHVETHSRGQMNEERSRPEQPHETFNPTTQRVKARRNVCPGRNEYIEHKLDAQKYKARTEAKPQAVEANSCPAQVLIDQLSISNAAPNGKSQKRNGDMDMVQLKAMRTRKLVVRLERCPGYLIATKVPKISRDDSGSDSEISLRRSGRYALKVYGAGSRSNRKPLHSTLKHHQTVSNADKSSDAESELICDSPFNKYVSSEKCSE